ncbi:MAG: CRISPR-associated endonuclease Cas1 [Candidatus Micrarchaeaceae archaeon]
MNPLLISGFGTSITVDRRRLTIVNKLENKKLEFYPHQFKSPTSMLYDSVIIDGHSGYMTFDAERWLMKHDVPIVMLNWDGNLLATTLPKEPISGRLKLSQYQAYLNDSWRFRIAQYIIDCKVKSESEFLEELASYYSVLDMEFIRTCSNTEFSAYSRDIKHAKNIRNKINTLMLYEARMANIFWEQMAKVFRQVAPDFNFQSRKNKSFFHNTNASDEINALLNYGYAILEADIRGSINAVGLDPCIGFLHEADSSKMPLVYDFQEPYRWLVDLSVLQLLEEKVLKKSSFIVTENFHIRLREDTAKMLIDKLRMNFNDTTPHRNVNYKNQVLIFENLRALSNHLQGKSSDLTFTLPEIKLKRTDSIDVKEDILKITPEERKRLHINKSTLWYMQKNIREGKKIKIYNKIMTKLAN